MFRAFDSLTSVGSLPFLKLMLWHTNLTLIASEIGVLLSLPLLGSLPFVCKSTLITMGISALKIRS